MWNKRYVRFYLPIFFFYFIFVHHIFVFCEPLWKLKVCSHQLTGDHDRVCDEQCDSEAAWNVHTYDNHARSHQPDSMLYMHEDNRIRASGVIDPVVSAPQGIDDCSLHLDDLNVPEDCQGLYPVQSHSTK